MSFPLDILGCNVHSILDVIKGFHHLKDCEDSPPIATADPSDELTAFEKTEISPLGWLLANCCWSNFALEKQFLHKNLISQVTQCTLVIPDTIKIIHNICMTTLTSTDTIHGTSEINALVVITLNLKP